MHHFSATEVLNDCMTMEAKRLMGPATSQGSSRKYDAEARLARSLLCGSREISRAHVRCQIAAKTVDL